MDIWDHEKFGFMLFLSFKFFSFSFGNRCAQNWHIYQMASNVTTYIYNRGSTDYWHLLLYRPEDMTPEVWNYVYFNDAKYPEGCAIKKDVMEKMKNEFKYWYPLDLRVSGVCFVRDDVK